MFFLCNINYRNVIDTGVDPPGTAIGLQPNCANLGNFSKRAAPNPNPNPSPYGLRKSALTGRCIWVVRAIGLLRAIAASDASRVVTTAHQIAAHSVASRCRPHSIAWSHGRAGTVWLLFKYIADKI